MPPSKKRIADIRMTCPVCPKTVVGLSLVSETVGEVSQASYEGMCGECGRECELTVTDMPKEL